MANSIPKSEDEWKSKLSAEEYHCLRECGTETPGSGKYNKFYEPGTYHCVGCNAKLFR